MKTNLMLLDSFPVRIAAMFGLVIIVMFFIQGGAWVGEKIYPLIYYLFGITFWAFIILLIPLAFIKKTRLLSSRGMHMSSFVFGINLWLTCFLLTYNLWGPVALFIGLIAIGIGVIPIAILATLFKGMWPTLGELVVIMAMIYGARTLSIYVATKVVN